MKYLKTFENLENKIEEGDYIIIKVNDNYWPSVDKIVREFINNNIGQITRIVPYNTDVFYITYENIPDNIKNSFYEGKFSININKIPSEVNIVDISKDKNDLEYIHTYNKYNL